MCCHDARSDVENAPERLLASQAAPAWAPCFQQAQHFPVQQGLSLPLLRKLLFLAAAQRLGQMKRGWAPCRAGSEHGTELGWSGGPVPMSPLCFCSLCWAQAEGLRAGGQRGGTGVWSFWSASGSSLYTWAGSPGWPWAGQRTGEGQQAGHIWWCLLLAWVFFASKKVESGSQFAGRILTCYPPTPTHILNLEPCCSLSVWAL